MKNGLACGLALLAALVLAGCASGPPSSAAASSGGARCLSRPDSSGTQPLIYLFCIQTN